MIDLDERHNSFLQNLLFKPLVSAKELKAIYAKCFSKKGSFSEQEVHELVNDLNQHLKLAQLAIKSRFCEDANEEFYAIISVIEGEASKHSLEFTAPELELFKRILKEIIASDYGTVSSIECINFSADIQRLSKTDAQKALEKFISSHWLKEKEGEVSLTVRSLLELEPLIRRIDNEIPECKLCGNVTIKGLLCPSCNAKFHHHCLAKFSKSGQSINKCPTCRQPWSNLDASTSSNGKEAQDTSVSNTSMRRGRKKRQIASDSDSD